MLSEKNRIVRERNQKREVKWDALNTASEGAFQTRTRLLLDEQPRINTLDARIKTLAEEGWKDGKIAQALGYTEKTIYNRCSKMRKIAGVDSKTPFRLVFYTPPRLKETQSPDAPDYVSGEFIWKNDT